MAGGEVVVEQALPVGFIGVASSADGAEARAGFCEAIEEEEAVVEPIEFSIFFAIDVRFEAVDGPGLAMFAAVVNEDEVGDGIAWSGIGIGGSCASGLDEAGAEKQANQRQRCWIHVRKRGRFGSVKKGESILDGLLRRLQSRGRYPYGKFWLILESICSSQL